MLNVGIFHRCYVVYTKGWNKTLVATSPAFTSYLLPTVGPTLIAAPSMRPQWYYLCHRKVIKHKYQILHVYLPNFSMISQQNTWGTFGHFRVYCGELV